MGDFVKGRPETLVNLYPEGVITGIRQHRATDYFTDSHPTFKQARALLSPKRSRLAGIVVDVIYDYFLSQQWPGGDIARQKFILHCHGTLLSRDEWLPENFRLVLPRMISESWLESYSTLEGLALTFKRIATRSPVAAGVLGAEDDFLQNREQFEALFDEFIPELMSFTKEWIEAQS